jgi:hypothetical protein
MLSMIAAPSARAEYRTWTSDTGKTMRAELVAADTESVTVRRESDETLLTIPRNRLSTADRDYVDDYLHDVPAPVRPPPKAPAPAVPNPDTMDRAPASTSTKGGGSYPSFLLTQAEFHEMIGPGLATLGIVILLPFIVLSIFTLRRTFDLLDFGSPRMLNVVLIRAVSLAVYALFFWVWLTAPEFRNTESKPGGDLANAMSVVLMAYVLPLFMALKMRQLTQMGVIANVVLMLTDGVITILTLMVPFCIFSFVVRRVL